ncbi:hypothetical protein SAVERM_5927 [Streptomyces avermitilis MA-4680 = NBRC 14893]|uniref:Uncharacterized protein n=1 Tax=Streptomyces avermitilis (strain ATCC 31267 / DSM 46492 / JCM 5070 / NBRC 14893 / NCIMB 12804 / NRRL 8165 / MA-4680) TaxID=227882 RepID=Q82AX8_STRAW|nr:hypothetical protein SAVERM_5927 [Streptomyces avermitilis MA-4680 = NBRC 14893]
MGTVSRGGPVPVEGGAGQGRTPVMRWSRWGTVRGSPSSARTGSRFGAPGMPRPGVRRPRSSVSGSSRRSTDFLDSRLTFPWGLF